MCAELVDTRPFCNAINDLVSLNAETGKRGNPVHAAPSTLAPESARRKGQRRPAGTHASRLIGARTRGRYSGTSLASSISPSLAAGMTTRTRTSTTLVCSRAFTLRLVRNSLPTP